MRKIAFVTTTSTYAAKGNEVLKNKGIVNEIRKIQGGTVGGCLFGITVNEDDTEQARILLNESGVRVIMEKVLSK